MVYLIHVFLFQILCANLQLWSLRHAAFAEVVEAALDVEFVVDHAFDYGILWYLNVIFTLVLDLEIHIFKSVEDGRLILIWLLRIRINIKYFIKMHHVKSIWVLSIQETDCQFFRVTCINFFFKIFIIDDF